MIHPVSQSIFLPLKGGGQVGVLTLTRNAARSDLSLLGRGYIAGVGVDQ